jgi:uncharacterized protein (TIGR02246 family)
MNAEEILRDALDRWKAGVDAGDSRQVADVFTDDAIFQGLRPYSVGRQGIADYYASQPSGITVSYRILETREPAADVVLGYVNADFTFMDQPPVHLHLGVLVSRGLDGWRISHYQASRLDLD